MGTDVKKIYAYVICLISLLILLWGIVDILSASVSLVMMKPQTISYEPMSPEPASPLAGEIKGIEPSIEEYYQRRMVLDRVGDSLSRIVISGLVFCYFSLKLKASEKA